jgi:predicted esterase
MSSAAASPRSETHPRPGRFVVGLLLLATTSTAAEVTTTEHRVDDNPRQTYFLNAPADADAEPPEEGYRLLLVLPGGDGSADFKSFVTNIHRQATPEHFLTAQLVAPQWSPDQAENLVWPLRKNPYEDMEFATEDFIKAVVDEIAADYPLDPTCILVLGWSSGGPAAYAAALSEDLPVTGAFIAMSVFKRDNLPSLRHARHQAFYLYHSPDDFIAMRFPEEASRLLKRGRALVELKRYAGGHGWHGDVYGDIRGGLDWLVKASTEQARRRAQFEARREAARKRAEEKE